MTVEESRALAVAINSLRFNPDLSDIEAQSYEIALANMRNRMHEGGVSVDRLTKQIDGEAVFKECANKYENCIGGDWPCVRPILARLAAYEDTGLTPEEVVALQESQKALKKMPYRLYRQKLRTGL